MASTDPATANQKDGLLHVFAPIVRVDDEQRMVEMYAFVNEVVEGEGGIRLKRSAMEAATPDFIRWGAMREMHQPTTPGTWTAVEWDQRGARLRGFIVDDLAWKKVKSGVYKGGSVGVKPVIIRGKDVDECRWVETSLVDRPKDPDATFVLSRFDDAAPPADAAAADLSPGPDASPAAETGEVARDAASPAPASGASGASGVTSATPNLPIRENLEGRIPGVMHYACGSDSCCGHVTRGGASECTAQRADGGAMDGVRHYQCGTAECHAHLTRGAAFECMQHRVDGPALLRLLDAAHLDAAQLEAAEVAEAVTETSTAEERASVPDQPPMKIGPTDTQPADAAGNTINTEGFADPGYQGGVARLPLKVKGEFDAGRVREAWRAFHEDIPLRDGYTLAQIRALHGQIKAAAQYLGLTLDPYPDEHDGAPVYGAKGHHRIDLAAIDAEPDPLVRRAMILAAGRVDMSDELIARLEAVQAEVKAKEGADQQAQEALIARMDSADSAQKELLARIETAEAAASEAKTALADSQASSADLVRRLEDVTARLERVEQQPVHDRPVMNAGAFTPERVIQMFANPLEGSGGADPARVKELQTAFTRLSSPTEEERAKEAADEHAQTLRVSALMRVKSELAALGHAPA